ncbi:hypothetical protein TNCV_2864181 [Trichonephila clavipes]|nr:hypothetical protein TNCV_2864181 [Trichonephila clavipes]
MEGQDNWLAEQAGISSPSYAKVAKAGAKHTAAVLKLWDCTKCPAKCYTEKGLRSHSESCPGKGNPRRAGAEPQQ